MFRTARLASLLETPVDCWASLCTARAIGYCARNGICPNGLGLAVVVQEMVESEVSGVLFTANPLTGKRGETVIDATLGLGEALVSGKVEPDHYVVDAPSALILSKSLGEKVRSTRGRTGGGTVELREKAAAIQALPDSEIIALSRLGAEVEDHFDSPQDIEWAWAGGKLSILQSRPVTSLYPLPSGLREDHLELFFSFGVWQGMLDPYTPIGQDIFLHLVAGLGSMFGIRQSPEKQRGLLVAGERLFVNLTGLLGRRLGRTVLGVFIESIDPPSGKILAKQMQDSRLPPPSGLGPGDRLSLARGMLPVIRRVLGFLLRPERGRAALERIIEGELAQAAATLDSAAGLSALARAIVRLVGGRLGAIMPRLLAGVIAGQAPLQILIRRIADVEGGTALAMELTRGLPHNVTTEMDLGLWRTARAIRDDPPSAARFSAEDADALAAAFMAGQLEPAAQSGLGDFLGRYGLRGVGEIDLGRGRWRDDPSLVIAMLKSYLEIDEAASPEESFRRGAEKACRARDELLDALRRRPGGRFKARLAGAMASWVRELGGLLETPKFFVVRLFGVIRKTLLDSGKALAEAGTVERPDDLVFLRLAELEALGTGDPRDWKALIAERRATYTRELRRRRVPRFMLSDGTAFYEAASDAERDGVLRGSPVSAGIAEGLVRVVVDPRGIQMVPGEVLVCPATDPAWTPLFQAAGALVMEAGGMMTHGSVVAREYGIPAVVGLRDATRVLKSGQRVRVDGSTGTVVVLDSNGY